MWLNPATHGGTPRWGSKPFPRADRAGTFIVLASGRNADGALQVRSDAEVYGAFLQAGTTAAFTFPQGDAGYLVPATGEIEVNGLRVRAREGLVIQDEKKVSVKALTASELVLVVTG
jgi:redox-sensitive bicupin YhaK (pirin superfamily)